MASKVLLIVIIIVMVAAPSMANDYLVGDQAGWRVGVDYTEWTRGKKFHVGDTITFVYKLGTDNVLNVNETEFQQCKALNTNDALVSGNMMINIITLSKPGKEWYISEVDDHCSKGVKLVIAVTEAAAMAPASVPTPASGSSGAYHVTLFRSVMWILAAFALLKMIMA